MTTQIMFKIEDKLKKAIQKRAKREGITLSDLFQSTARSFADGRLNVGLITEGDNWQNQSKKNMLKAYSSTDSIYDSL